MSSRESDSAYPSPRQGGRRPEGSPEAYPSGTPPYGTGLPNGAHPEGGLPGDAPGGPGEDLPKTETTLTTRVRINIPGSRPIPPVVVRSTMKNEEPPAEPAGPRHRSASAASPVLGMVDPGPGTAAPELPAEWQQPEPPAPAAASSSSSSSESTGEWFRPRQKTQSQSGPVPAAAGAPRPAAATQQQQQQPGPVPSGAPASPFGGDTGSHPLPQTPPPAPTNPYGNDPFATQRPAGPVGPAGPDGQGATRRDAFGGGQAAGQPGGPRRGAFPGGPNGPAGRPGPQGGRPGGQYGNDPFQTGAPRDPFATGGPRDPFAPQGPGQGGPETTRALRMPQAPNGQGGPETTRALRMPQAPNGQGGAAETTRALRVPQTPPGFEEPEDTQIGGFEPIREDGPATAAIPGLPTANRFGGAAAPADPFGTTAPNAPADPFGTAAPKAPGAPQAPGTPGGGGRFAEHAFEPAPPFPGTLGHNPAAPPIEVVPEPDPDRDDEPVPAAAPKKRPSKAPKLAVYAVGGLLFVGAAAYGTGLMLNQADIPKGTTVLGTDIGGDARDQAISALDSTVGKIGQRPIKLKVGAQTVNLDPATAGLSFDTTATVDGLTSHSYNPVDVISSITGGSKAVAPEVKVDRAKLKAALDALGGSAGQGLQEGFVQFTADGQAQVVPGKAGQTVDGAAALDQVEQAYRDRAAGKDDTVLTVPVTAAQPKIGQDALQAAADSLGKQVLSMPVTVVAGTKKFEFGKATAAAALTIAPDASGKLALKWDLDKLNEALKGVFDKSKVKKNGALAPITPQDVADGIASVLSGTTAKERTFKFPA